MTKAKKRELVKNILLLIIGSSIVALANALFIVPFNIVKGGMTSVAMIISDMLFSLTGTDLTSAFLGGFNIVLWIIAFFLVSRRFALSSLVGTLAYPLFLTLFTRIDLVNVTKLMDYFNSGDQTGKLILFGLAGGVINGAGLSLCFMGKGSTGGSDVLSALMVKYLNWKQSNASLFIDGIIIILGFIFYKDWGNLLVGILSALASSLAVRNIYGKQNTVYVLDILTDKVEEVKEVIMNELQETCTIYTVEGGYSKDTKKVVHCVLKYKEMKILKSVVPSLDPKAFVSVYEASAAYGGSTEDAYIKKSEKERILSSVKKTKGKKKGKKEQE